MSKPTPGPWIAANVCGIGDPGIEVYNKPFGLGVIGWAKSAEDADLFAEAGTVHHKTGLTPRQLAEQRGELLEALEDMLHLCCHDLGMDDESPYIEKARDAIDKATGQTQNKPVDPAEG